jgi:hypothetical protein
MKFKRNIGKSQTSKQAMLQRRLFKGGCRKHQMTTRIDILGDNTSVRKGFGSEHGIFIWIQMAKDSGSR